MKAEYRSLELLGKTKALLPISVIIGDENQKQVERWAMGNPKVR